MGAEDRTSAVELLAGAVLAFLRRYPPFDEMEESALRFLAQRLFVGYYAKGVSILAPEHGEPQFFYIIRSGLVNLAPAETYHLPAAANGALRAGECFSVGGLLERRPVTSAYVAAAARAARRPKSTPPPAMRRSPRLADGRSRRGRD